MGKVMITEWEVRYRSLNWETEEFFDYVSREAFDDQAEAEEVYHDLVANPNVYSDVHLMRRSVVRDEAEWVEISV